MVDAETGKTVPLDEAQKAFEAEPGLYVTVTEQEIERSQPKPDRLLNVSRFLPIDAIDPLLYDHPYLLGPVFLERGYYLTPQKEATKAYRLLAQVMERTGRAGIATFVMRDREYLVAIFARAGILCAETLRFHDETRAPAAIGLPHFTPAPRVRVSAFERAIEALSARAMPTGELGDEDDEKLRAIIRKKIRPGKDLVRIEAQTNDGDLEDEDGGDVDLLETIRLSLRAGARSGGARRKPAEASRWA